MARKNKLPRKGESAASSVHIPVIGISRKDPNDLRPILSYDLMDLNGPWCFSKASPRALQIAMQTLYSVCQITWRELLKGGSHFIDKDAIIQKAQDRLEEIGLGEYDQVYSLRCTGAIRVFGIRDREVFNIIWLDEHHAICPSQLKNT